jgi:hypothetical protein
MRRREIAASGESWVFVVFSSAFEEVCGTAERETGFEPATFSLEG